MGRRGYRVVSVSEELYRRVLDFAGGRSFPEALRRLLPVCVGGYGWRGHVFVRAAVEEVVVDDVYFVDLGGLPVRLDEAVRLFEALWKSSPLIALAAGLLALKGLEEGAVRVLQRPVKVKVGVEGYFLVDTGASVTVLNSALFPQEARRVVMAAEKQAPVKTATDVVKLSSGVARLSMSGVSLEERVLIVDMPSSNHHIMGVDTLRRLFGGRVLIDFEKARVCRLGV